MTGVYAVLMIFITLLMAAVPVILFAVTARGLSNWSTQRNMQRNMPLQAARARVIDKTTSVTGHGEYTRAAHYVTFELESGQRLTFPVDVTASNGQLVVGDTGLLHFKGQRYLGFQRELNPEFRPAITDGFQSEGGYAAGQGNNLPGQWPVRGTGQIH